MFKFWTTTINLYWRRSLQFRILTFSLVALYLLFGFASLSNFFNERSYFVFSFLAGNTTVILIALEVLFAPTFNFVNINHDKALNFKATLLLTVAICSMLLNLTFDLALVHFNRIQTPLISSIAIFHLGLTYPLLKARLKPKILMQLNHRLPNYRQNQAVTDHLNTITLLNIIATYVPVVIVSLHTSIFNLTLSEIAIAFTTLGLLGGSFVAVRRVMLAPTRIE